MLRPAVAFLLACAAGTMAAAAQPARFLAVTVTAGFRHGSIATGEAVLEEIGRTSGLFHVDYLRMPPGKQTQPPRPKRAAGTTDDEWNAQQQAFQATQDQFKKDDDAWRQTLKDAFARAFSAESLASFDGVMFVNTTGKLPVPDLASLLEGTAWALGRIDAPAAPNPAVQAAEYLRSVIAAASDATGRNPDALLAKADGKIARDPQWALGLRPQLLAIRGLKPEDRAAAYEKVIDEVAK